MDSKKRIRYHVICDPIHGETECGDQYLVKELSTSVLIAVADGLGHGSEAAFAAKKAMQIIDMHAEQSLEQLVMTCNEFLTSTRGITLTIARITDEVLTYIAIGNVTGVCWQMSRANKLTKESLLLEGGVVGYKIPPIKIKKIPIQPGDIFILATDGLKETFEIEAPNFLKSPQFIATNLFDQYRNPKDDALILVAQMM